MQPLEMMCFEDTAHKGREQGSPTATGKAPKETLLTASRTATKPFRLESLGGISESDAEPQAHKNVWFERLRAANLRNMNVRLLDYVLS